MAKEAIDYLPLVKERLKYYGLVIPDGDTSRDADIEFSIELCERRVLDFCNIDELPAGINNPYVDMIACDYLEGMLASGKMPLDDIERVAQTIRVGDTQVSYGTANDITMTILNYTHAKCANMSAFLKYRRMSW